MPLMGDLGGSDLVRSLGRVRHLYCETVRILDKKRGGGQVRVAGGRRRSRCVRRILHAG